MDVDEDCDEDVIFENSPLYQHLQEAGVTDIDVEPIRANSTRAKQVSVIKPADKKWTLSNFSKLCRVCLDSVASLFHRKRKKDEITYTYQHKVLQSLCTSPVLVEEDKDFLEEFVREEVSVSGKNKTSNIHSKLKQILPSAILPCFLASLAARVISPETSNGLVLDISLTVMGILGTIFIAKVAIDYRKRRNFDQLYLLMNDFLQSAQHLVTLSRKSLRLIQEMELVARGFTLVSQKTAVSQLDQKPSVSTMRQCPELRRCLFKMARSSTLELREATLSLINLHPLIPEIDSISHYLCGISLEEYGPCLSGQTGEGDEEELYHLTDGYSVAALKAMTELFSLHLSEFVRRLALCFSSQSQPPDTDVRNPFESLDISNQLHGKLKSKEMTLHRLYDFHKSSPQGRQPKHHTMQDKHTSQMEELYVAIHSLDLHLQAAITRVRDLASDLETKMEDKEASQDDTMNQNWESFMSGVKAELEACKGCWEEGMSRLEKSRKTVPKLDSIPDLTSTTEQTKVIPFAEIGDPIIEDQVFEGYTDPDEVESDPWGWEPVLSPEEREKKKREKQEALRLLTELKSVISVRAQDREKREQMALQRMGQGKTTLTNTIESDSNTISSDLSESESKTSLGDELIPVHKSRDLGTGDVGADIREGDKEQSSSGAVPQSHGDPCLSDKFSEVQDTLVNSTNISVNRHYPAGDEPVSQNTDEKDSNRESPIKDNLLEQSKNIVSASNREEEKSSCSITNVPSASVNVPSAVSVNVTSASTSVTSAPLTNPSAFTNVLSAPSTMASVRETERAELKERLERLHGRNLGFTANVAAMAAARSVHMGMSEQTFGDTFGDSSSDEPEEGN